VIPPQLDCDRNFARSQFGLVYLDRMTYALKERHVSKRTKVGRWRYLPFYQAIDFNKGFWWQHSHYRRATHAEKIFQNKLGLFLYFDAFEAERYTIDELYATFPGLFIKELMALIEPMLSEDVLPPVVYYYGVQLSLLNGLPKNHHRRLFLEDCLYHVLILNKVFTYYTTLVWNNRAAVVSKEVLEIIENAGLGGLDLGL